MLPPSCARCGAPLPAVAADPTHPEWCGACAARALDAPGMPPSVPSASGRTSQAPWNNPTTAPPPAEGAPVLVKTRILDGLLTGIAASALAGALWWGVATAILKSDSSFEPWHLGSIVVGLLVGEGVLTGSRKGGVASGLLALVLSAVTVAVTIYFIGRSGTVIALTDAGRTSDIPLWQGVEAFTDTYRSWWDYDRKWVGPWLIGPVVALVVAGWPGRRPIAA